MVIDNFSAGVLDRWGIGYDVVSAKNPEVIYVQMSGMGDSGGPWSDFVTYAPTIHALTGLTSLTGVPGRQDIGIGFSYNDHQSGLHGVFAILAALSARHQSGRGQRVDISQFEVGANFAGPSLMDFFANGRPAQACGNRLPYDAVAPHNVYRCAPSEVAQTADERWVAIACMNDEQWAALVELMGNPHWAVAGALSSAAGRVAAVRQLDEEIAAWTKDQDAYEVMARCQAAGVPAGVVQNGVDLVERDPQLRLSGFVQRIEDQHPTIGQTYADRLPLHFQKTPCNRYERVRALGEDNAAVLEDWLGMSETDMAAYEGVLK